MEVLIHVCTFSVHNERERGIWIASDESVLHCDGIVIFMFNCKFNGVVNGDRMLCEVIHLRATSSHHPVIDVPSPVTRQTKKKTR